MITIMQIHLNEPPGDVLLFLTGWINRFPSFGRGVGRGQITNVKTPTQ